MSRTTYSHRGRATFEWARGDLNPHNLSITST